MSDKTPTNGKPFQKGYNGQSIIAARNNQHQLVNDGYNASNSIRTRQQDNFKILMANKPVGSLAPVKQSTPTAKSGKNV
jgi:hypothetical protein